MMHLLPQLPCRNRYTEDWIGIWRRELKNLGVQFEVLGHDSPTKVTKYFTDPLKALDYESGQISALARANPEKIFCLDVEFPGLVSPAIQVLRLINPDLKAHGYLHAGSWCDGDIWNKTCGRQYLDRMIFDTFDKIFVATCYHKKKIENHFGEEFVNLEVVGFPFYKKDVLSYVKPLPFEEKDLILISGRMEQSNQHLVSKIKENFKDEKVVVVNANSRKEYYEILNRGRVVISLKTEETFGVGQLEVGVLGGVPLSPDDFAYPEVIGDECLLYSDEKDLMDKLAYLLQLKQNLFQIDTEKYEKVIPNILSSIRNT